ncbi:hypothetical protein LTR95_005315 [Oleoguttula sp. CCFEE 5521]
MAKKGDLLFELAVGSNGNIVVTQPAPKVYLISFTSPPDNRLTTKFCTSLILALDILATRHPAGVVITTSGITKFYSNGLDLDHASFTPGFFPEALYALWLRLLTYPMPTVALINGHAFAGAFMTAMMHDYRVMNPHRGFLCLNELELGVPLRAPMSSVFREKLSPVTYRKLVLEAARMKALDALKESVVDSLGGLEEALTFIDEMKLVAKASPGLTGKSALVELKREMYRETVGYLENFRDEDARDFKAREQEKTRQAKRQERVAKWERAKL